MMCEWHNGEAHEGEWFYDETIGKEVWVCKACLDGDELEDDSDE